MSKEIKTSVKIKANAARVWQVLSNFKSYPEWNPFIKKIEGDIKVGQTFKTFIQPPGNKGMSFQPTVLVYDAQKEFKWIGHLWFKGLFDGEHRFLIEANEDGSTTLHQSEKFSGLLVPLFKKMLDRDTLEGFRLMNDKLKEIAEQVPS